MHTSVTIYGHQCILFPNENIMFILHITHVLIPSHRRKSKWKGDSQLVNMTVTVTSQPWDLWWLSIIIYNYGLPLKEHKIFFHFLLMYKNFHLAPKFLQSNNPVGKGQPVVPFIRNTYPVHSTQSQMYRHFMVLWSVVNGSATPQQTVLSCGQ